MNQRGFIALPLTSWIMLGMGVIVLGLGIALKFQTARLESCKTEYQAFVAKVEALGVEAQKRKVAQEAQDKLNKENADAERKKLLASNADLAQRLREHTRRGSLSSPETTPRIPESACVKGKAINDAVSRYIERLEQRLSGLAELAITGQSAIDDLNNAKQWAQGAEGNR